MSEITRREFQIGLLTAGAGVQLAHRGAFAQSEGAPAGGPPAPAARLLFLAASGDSGFRLKTGASASFVAALILVPGGEQARAVETAVRDAKAAQGITGQLRFKGSSPQAKDAFFTAIASAPFTLHAAAVQKERIDSPRLRAEGQRFQHLVVNRLLKEAGSLTGTARLVVDRTCNRDFRTELARRLAKPGAAKPRSVAYSAPESDLLLQLAQMCAGALARSYRAEDAEAARWRTMLQGRTSTVWELV